MAGPFPSSPNNGDTHTPDNGITYKYNSSKDAWLIQAASGGGGSASAMTGATASVAGTAGIVPVPAAGTNYKFLRGDGTWTGPTFVSASAPTVNDDSGDGFFVGAMWFDSTAGVLYTAKSVGVGAAVWSQVGGSSSGGDIFETSSAVGPLNYTVDLTNYGAATIIVSGYATVGTHTIAITARSTLAGPTVNSLANHSVGPMGVPSRYTAAWNIVRGPGGQWLGPYTFPDAGTVDIPISYLGYDTPSANFINVNLQGNNASQAPKLVIRATPKGTSTLL